MESYDVLIVGAATSGSFLARRLSESGRRVLVIDRLSRQQLGKRLDIFHVGQGDFTRFNLPLPEPDDDLAFTFTGGQAFSAFGRHPKETGGTIVGMHMPRYIARLNRWAEEAGAEFRYGAAFVDFLYEDGRIAGAIFEEDGERHSVTAKLVADCSGIPSVARRKLPEGYGVENFEISDLDKFYVTLRYVSYEDPADHIKSIRTWTYYKTWEAPEADPAGAILGVGANFSYDYGEEVFARFEKAIKLPRYTLKYIERGTTPYRRPPYSFVADGFLVCGDAACLTKPSAGEGVTSSMVQLEIAADVLSRLLGEGGYLTRARLWPINKGYVEAQGKAFAAQLATLVGATASSAEENDFFFEKDIIFSAKTFAGMAGGETLRFSTRELINMALCMLGGVLSGRLRISTIRTLLTGMQNGGRAEALYAEYPAEEAGFDDWTRRADAMWAACGSMADNRLS